MNSSKDFEITADGELIAYHGKGGCVAIPEGVIFVARDGIFDPKLKITKLKLPSTLLGHKYVDGCEDAYVAHQPKDDDDDDLYIEKYDSDVYVTVPDWQILFSPLCLELPYLESYEVADANVIYHSVDGLLYFSGESFFDDEVPNFILDIPKAKEIPARLDCSYKEYLQRDRELRDLPGPPIVVEIDEEFLTRELISKAHNLGANHTRYNNLLIIHAPHAKSCEVESAYAYRIRFIKFVIVAPDMELVSRDSQIQCQAALGYIYKPEWYNHDQTERAKLILKVVESHAYQSDENSDMPPVISYYHKLWDDKTVSTDEPKSDVQACIQLIDAVLYGSLDDVKRALSYDFDFYGSKFHEYEYEAPYHGGVDAINVACRYGGVEKLTYLLEHEKFTTKSHGHNECIAQKFYSCRTYWPIFHNCFKITSNYYYVVGNGELRNLQPLPKIELFKCLESLVNHNTFYKETPGRLWFYAFMFGLDDLADSIINAVDLDYFFYQAKDTGLRYDISSIFNEDIRQGAERTIELSKLMQSRGHELTLNEHVGFSDVYFKPALAKKIFDNVTVAHWAKHYFVEFHIKCLCRKEMSLNHEIEDLTKVEEAFLALLNSKRNGTAQMVRWCIEYAQEHEKTELVANLLNILNHKLGNNSQNFRSQEPLKL